MNRDQFQQVGLLVLRLAVGLQLAILHGWGKFRGFSSLAGSFPDPLHIGHKYSLMATVAAELVCGLLIALGLLTRFAAGAVAFTMAVAALLVHAHDGWAQRELALLYLGGALAVLALGPGRLSLDARMLGRGAGRASSARMGRAARA